jgi:hypothetical protein
LFGISIITVEGEGIRGLADEIRLDASVRRIDKGSGFGPNDAYSWSCCGSGIEGAGLATWVGGYNVDKIGDGRRHFFYLIKKKNFIE